MKSTKYRWINCYLILDIWELFGKAEVDDLHVALRVYQQILGLQVSVSDASAASRRQEEEEYDSDDVSLSMCAYVCMLASSVSVVTNVTKSYM